MDSNILRAINLFIYSKTLNLHLMCVSACKYMYRVCAWPGKVRRGYQIPGAIDGYEPLYGRLDPLGKRMDANWENERQLASTPMLAPTCEPNLEALRTLNVEQGDSLLSPTLFD